MTWWRDVRDFAIVAALTALLIGWMITNTSNGQCFNGRCNTKQQQVVKVQKVQQVQKVIAQPVYQTPTVVNYFVGQPIRVEAMIEYERKNDPDWQRYLEYKKQKLEGSLQQESPATENTPHTASVLATSCFKCHGDNPKDNELSLTLTPMSRELRDMIIERVTLDEMPPGKPLPGDAKSALHWELYGTPIEEVPEEVPVPPQEFSKWMRTPKEVILSKR